MTGTKPSWFDSILESKSRKVTDGELEASPNMEAWLAFLSDARGYAERSYGWKPDPRWETLDLLKAAADGGDRDAQSLLSAMFAKYLMTGALTPLPASDTDPRTLGAAIIAEDLSIMNEVSSSWFHYSQGNDPDVIVARQYGNDGEFIAEYNVSVTVTRVI